MLGIGMDGAGANMDLAYDVPSLHHQHLNY